MQLRCCERDGCFENGVGIKSQNPDISTVMPENRGTVEESGLYRSLEHAQSLERPYILGVTKAINLPPTQLVAKCTFQNVLQI